MAWISQIALMAVVLGLLLESVLLVKRMVQPHQALEHLQAGLLRRMWQALAALYHLHQL